MPGPRRCSWRFSCGLVGAAADDIRLADPVGAAALGHRLAERNEARARRHAIFRIKPAGWRLAAVGEHDTATADRANPPDQAQPRRNATTPHRVPNTRGRPDPGRLPLNRIQPLTIARLEIGRNGAGFAMVNTGYPAIPVYD